MVDGTVSITREDQNAGSQVGGWMRKKCTFFTKIKPKVLQSDQKQKSKNVKQMKEETLLGQKKIRKSIKMTIRPMGTKGGKTNRSGQGQNHFQEKRKEIRINTESTLYYPSFHSCTQLHKHKEK